jgi:hypothetical protein
VSAASTDPDFLIGGAGAAGGIVACTIQALAYRAGAEITRLAREGALGW